MLYAVNGILSKVEFSVTLPTDYRGGWLIEIVVGSRGLAVDVVVCDTTFFWLMYGRNHPVTVSTY